MQKIVDKNEFVNQIILKLDENKVFLNSEGIMTNTELDNIKITNNEVSVYFNNAVINANFSTNEIVLNDLINNEIYTYKFKPDELKIKIMKNLVYIKMKIEEITPISLEALLRLLEALNIPFGSRFLSRFDIKLENYRNIEYDNEEGIKLEYGLTEVKIRKNKISVDNVTINLNDKGYFIFFEKGVMSILF